MDVNEHISIKITEMLLGRSNDNTKNREEKVNYSINNIINSVEKILILLALFASNRKIKEFFACYVVILLTRTYMGGIHMKTWMGCTIMTILVYICAVEGGCWIDVHSIEICIFIVLPIHHQGHEYQCHILKRLYNLFRSRPKQPFYQQGHLAIR